MTIKIFICLLSITDWGVGIAQSDRKIDTLKQVIKTTVEDSIKVNALATLGKQHWDKSEFEEAKICLYQALRLGEKLGYKNGLVKAYNVLGKVNESEGEHSEAMNNQETSLKIAREIEDKNGIAISYNDIGLIQWQMGNYSEALEYFESSLVLNMEIGNQERIASNHNNMGLIYDYTGNYPLALKHYQEALTIAEELKHPYGIATCNSNMAFIHGYQGNHLEALKCHELALKIWEETGDKSGVAFAHGNIGSAYHALGRNQEALDHANKSLSIAEEIGYKSGMSVAYDLIGSVYLDQHDYQESLKYGLHSLNIWKELENREKIANSSNLVGSAYMYLGKYTEAKRFLVDALKTAEEIGLLIVMRQAHYNLSKIEEAMGNYQNSLSHYHKYVELKDSLLNETTIKELAQVKEQYESEKKDKEIELLNKEKALQDLQLDKQKQTKSYFLAGLTLFGVLSFVVYRNYHAHQELKMLNLRNKIASDLHDDVGSTLSSISIFSQMAQAKSREVIPALESISESSRKMLDAMADIVWTINPENDQFEKIIMRMRTFAYELLGAKNIEYEFLVDENITTINLPMEARKNLYLIFKESTNNMVKYAAADKAMFSIKGQKDKLTMVIRDNGKGFDISKEYDGNGLKNMKKRAIEVGGDLLLDSSPGMGTTIKLELAI